MDRALARALMDTALGRLPVDLVVTHATVLNVFTGELLPDQTIAVKAGHFAAVGADLPLARGPETVVLDAAGQIAIPGLIDGHTHQAPRLLPETLLDAVLASGTTTIITELEGMAFVGGAEGLRVFLDALRDQPIKVFATLPPMAALHPALEERAPTLAEAEQLLARADVVGLGEIPWANLLRDAPRLLDLVALARRLGKQAEGHSAGARGARLQAYFASGIGSCHEPIAPDEVRERLRLGVHTMVRHGGVRRDIDRVAPLWAEPLDWRRLVLVTDSVDARGLLADGYLDAVVQRAIDTGLDPVRAIQAATLNVAEHFRLDHRLGAIAPGREADLALVPDLRTIRPTLVLSRGQPIAREGRPLVRARRHRYPPWLYHTLRLPEVTADWFRLPTARGAERLRALGFGEGLVTGEAWVEVGAADRAIALPRDADLAKLACIERQTPTPRRFVGLAQGFGLRAGACATTSGWDAACITAIGVEDADLALAVNRVRALQGGVVVCAGGRVLAECATPVGALWSEESVAAVAAAEERLEGALHALGVRHPRPLLALDILTTGAIPHLRLTPLGYVRLRDGALLGLTDPA